MDNAAQIGSRVKAIAGEARGLAVRSATTANGIEDLIQDSVKKVEDGSVLVTQCGAPSRQPARPPASRMREA
jgi:methyl-accepting chemotaxis protein